MPKDWIKLVERLPSTIQKPVVRAIKDIQTWNISLYRPWKIVWSKYLYRIRAWKVRIIVRRIDANSYIIEDIKFRGDAYKKH